MSERQAASSREYLYAEQLAELTPWSMEAIARMVRRGVLRVGVHYFQPQGSRGRLIFKWRRVVELIEGRTGDPRDVVGEPATVALDVEEATQKLHRLLG